MHWKYSRCLVLLLVLICLGFGTHSAKGQIPPRPSNFVTDLAGIVEDGAEARLNGFLYELAQKTTVQFAVLTISGLGGASIEDLAVSIAHDKWKLGQKGKDNGLLLLVAHKDRKYRIEVGYGLEGILPDSLVGSVGRQHLIPNFRTGDYSRGIYDAVIALTAPVIKSTGITISGTPLPAVPATGNPADEEPTLMGRVMSILFFILLAVLFIRNPRLFMLLLIFTGMSGRQSSWGGGGGGFGGGGGGGFGGGGASGSW